MRSKSMVLLILILLSVTLTGCTKGIDKAIDSIANTQSMSFVKDEGGILSKIITLVVLLALIPLGAWVYLSIRKAAIDGNWEDFAISMGVLVCASVIPFLLLLLTKAGNSPAFWPEGYSLSRILDSLGIALPFPKDLNPIGIGLTIQWVAVGRPLTHMIWEIALVVIVIFCLLASALSGSWKPIAIAIAAVLGWLISTSFQFALTELFAVARPKGISLAGIKIPGSEALLSTLLTINLVYTAGSVLMDVLCYLVPPLLVLVFLPPSLGRPKIKLDMPEGSKGSGTSLTPVPIVIGGVSQAAGAAESGAWPMGSVPYRSPQLPLPAVALGAPDGGEDWVEGEFRTIPPDGSGGGGRPDFSPRVLSGPKEVTFATDSPPIDSGNQSSPGVGTAGTIGSSLGKTVGSIAGGAVISTIAGPEAAPIGSAVGSSLGSVAGTRVEGQVRHTLTEPSDQDPLDEKPSPQEVPEPRVNYYAVEGVDDRLPGELIYPDTVTEEGVILEGQTYGWHQVRKEETT